METETDFEREMLQWFDDVDRFAYSLTRNRADADDLLQETYLRAYRSRHTYRLGTNALCWLFTICLHRHIRTVAQAKRYVEFRDSDVASTPSVEDGSAQRELIDTVVEAIQRLPEPFREAIMLVGVEDRTYASAAAICRVPIGTIRSRLSRARRLIRDMMSVGIRRESSWQSTRESRCGAPRNSDSES
jgi:RNA polymerase sigma-70 factor, ECF subfamily